MADAGAPDWVTKVGTTDWGTEDGPIDCVGEDGVDRKSTRLNSSHVD